MTFDLLTNIISWNIQSSNTVAGSKFDDPQFCAIFEKFPIICLQEIRQAVKYPGFRPFNNPRPNNKYGGVCIMIKNEFARGVVLEKSPIEDVVACKLDKTFFGLECDVYIVNSYIKPAYTSSKNSELSGLDIMHELDQFINNLLGKGGVIGCGDFNARIGQVADFINEEKSGHESYIPLPDDYTPQDLPRRNSMDKTTNSYKKPFLDLLLNNKMHILNGRTLGDLFGEFTCIQSGGASVVDYFVISPNCSNYVCHMTVLPFTCFSDHRPLLLTLNLSPSSKIINSKPLHELYYRAPLRYKINADNLSDLRTKIDEPDITTSAQTILDNDYPSDQQSSYRLNKDVTAHLQKIADKYLQKTKHPKANKNGPINKKPWFTPATREAKQSMSKAATIVSDFPGSDYLRKHFYRVKNTYKKLVDRTKTDFFNKLNSDIESGKVLNWRQFKKLKKHRTTVDKFDEYDMENFKNFFANLYSNVHPTIPSEKKQQLLMDANKINENSIPSEAQAALNNIITTGEISAAIASLKNGKSASDDMISNEILKCLSEINLKLLSKVFNQCLDTGTYPWNNSIITPLHKKGCKTNPDNYRAVAVSSTIGKLFSTIILNRIITFKNVHRPDPINQLGFAKGAQTYDHILTLNTITSKYKKLKVPIYSVFVDFRKAFDSVCREALFLKLAKLGITGRTFDVLKHMYENSTGQIKLSGFVSDKFDVKKGTEQGHPLSPDLFKIYIRDLSPQLDHDNCTKLMNQLISHLLWADDLILLALDPETLQKQLDTLHSFCLEWGIDINADKTKFMKFGAGLDDHEPRSFTIGRHKISEVESYCYLGVEIHNSGSYSLARSELKKKAMRALYALKNTVNKTKLSVRSLTTLFDSLIKPIVLYGAPIYTPSMSIIKHIAKHAPNSNAHPPDILKKISLLNCEKLHLHFLKWALGVNRKACNAGIWGETGRYPLIYECVNLTLKYAKRLKDLDDNSLVSLAFKEQKNMNLDWYRGLRPILELDPCFSADHVTAFHLITNKHNSLSSDLNSKSASPPKEDFLIHNGIRKRIPPQSKTPISSNIFTPHVILKSLKQNFKSKWFSYINSSPKLEFYREIKSNFIKEQYLDQVTNYTDRANITRLRISAHRLEIELGRYNKTPRDERICSWCNLVLGVSTIENEAHLLNHCDLNAASRHKTMNKIKTLLDLNHCPASLSHSVSTITNHTNFMKVISTGSDHITSSLTSESQVQISRIIARYSTTCLNTRKTFQDSCGKTNVPD